MATNYENLEALRAALERLRERRLGNYHCPNTTTGLCSWQLAKSCDPIPCTGCPLFTPEEDDY